MHYICGFLGNFDLIPLMLMRKVKLSNRQNLCKCMLSVNCIDLALLETNLSTIAPCSANSALHF